jgi:calmodulin
MEAFKIFDRNGNGKISFDEIIHMMTNLSVENYDEEVHEILMCAELDVDREFK